MTSREADKLIYERWMMLTEEERFLTCGGMYSAEKALERCAPKFFSQQEVLEFVFYHMHGMTIEESINYVPDKIP